MITFISFNKKETTLVMSKNNDYEFYPRDIRLIEARGYYMSGSLDPFFY